VTPADIRAARARLGLTQTELARLLGMDPISLSRFERGALAPRHPEMLALALEALEHRRAERATAATTPEGGRDG
jgi:transcriptional regulator with XRE-family HTH domain